MEFGTKEKGSSLAERWPEMVRAHPLRARIVAALDGQELTAAKLADFLEEPVQRIGYHCRVLEQVAGSAGWS